MGGPSSSEIDNIRHSAGGHQVSGCAVSSGYGIVVTRVFVGHFWPGNNRVTNDKNFSEFLRFEI